MYMFRRSAGTTLKWLKFYPLVTSTKLCEKSQPINYVQYRQCVFFFDNIFSHVYQFGSSIIHFWHFLTSCICTQIKIMHHISDFFMIRKIAAEL